MAAHSSILAWRITRAEEPGGLQSAGQQSQTQLKPVCTRACEDGGLLEMRLQAKKPGNLPIKGGRDETGLHPV